MTGFMTSIQFSGDAEEGHDALCVQPESGMSAKRRKKKKKVILMLNCIHCFRSQSENNKQC